MSSISNSYAAAALSTGSLVVIPFWLEMFAVVAASISGALAARKNKLDLVGATTLAVVCSLGGGLLRDMILQVRSVYILEQPMALPIAMLTAVVSFVAPSFVYRRQTESVVAFLDILAVGIYSATGADKALVCGFSPLVCVMMGFITGVGGGMLRDGFMGHVPGIFQRTNFYAVASIGGAICYVALVDLGLMSQIAALVVCVLVTMGLRGLSVRFDLKSPNEDDLDRWFHRK